MSIEKTVICDHCGGVMASGPTVREARREARQGGAMFVDGGDFHADCFTLLQRLAGERAKAALASLQ